MKRIAILAVAAAALASPALASSADAWAEHEAAVVAACGAATGLKNPQAISELVMYDDSIGIDGLLLTGEYPQAHMAGQTAMVLCLYSKETGNAVVSTITPK